MVYNHVLSSADLTTLTNALMSKYALANAPTATLTAPLNGAQYTAPATITLTATASVSGGTISKVEFYNGTTLLGTSTSSPYSYTWTNVAGGQLCRHRHRLQQQQSYHAHHGGEYHRGHQCATPTFNPAAGTFTTSTSVTISTTTGGATIRYTTNGTTPSSTVGTVYSSAVSITATSTLQAIAYETGYANSAVASGVYTIQCAAPTFNPAAGAYGPAQSVTISTTTSGASIRYTTNGTTPVLDRRHGVQQPGEHLRDLDAGGHRLRDGLAEQHRDLGRLHHQRRLCHPDLQPGGGHLHQRHGDHQHHHQRREHPLHHQWHHPEFDGGHGV